MKLEKNNNDNLNKIKYTSNFIKKEESFNAQNNYDNDIDENTTDVVSGIVSDAEPRWPIARRHRTMGTWLFKWS